MNIKKELMFSQYVLWARHCDGKVHALCIPYNSHSNPRKGIMF